MRLLNWAWIGKDSNQPGWAPYMSPYGDHEIVLLDGLGIYDDETFVSKQKANVAQLKSMGKIVIGYISVGSWENYRYDSQPKPGKKFGDWPEQSVINVQMESWPDEMWVNLDHWELLKPVMKARLDRLKYMGFDGFEGDNISIVGSELYDNKPKERERLTPLNYAYAKWLADYAHSIGLLAFAKNTSSYLKDTVKYYDALIIEEAVSETNNGYNTMAESKNYWDAGKPVFVFEYVKNKQKLLDTIQKFNINSYTSTIQHMIDIRHGYEHIGGAAKPPAYASVSSYFKVLKNPLTDEPKGGRRH